MSWNNQPPRYGQAAGYAGTSQQAQGYGAPPRHSQYGVPPTHAQYGAQPPHSQYGAQPPLAQYSAPPLGQQQGYPVGSAPPPPNQPYGAPPPNQQPYGTAPPPQNQQPYGTAPPPQNQPPYGTAPPPQNQPPYGTAPPGRYAGGQSCSGAQLHPMVYAGGQPPAGYGGAQAPSGYGGGYAPPPGVSQDLWQWFQAVDTDRSGKITSAELRQALMNGNWTPFNDETCRLMIGMFDRDRNGTIDVHEFSSLWKYIQDWKSCFDSFDTDRSGNINTRELSNAFRTFGYNLSPNFCNLCVRVFDRQHNSTMNFDDFIQCCVMLKGLTDQFKQKDTNQSGVIKIYYEEFLKMVLDNGFV